MQSIPRMWTRRVAARVAGLALAALSCAGSTHAQEEPPQVRVACLGDSITQGARLEHPQLHAWPSQLGQRLGAGYEVRNFGVGGTTLLRAADRPFTGTAAWRSALEWRPDVAIVLLGTNDTCLDDRRRNWEHAGSLHADAVALAAELREARVGVRVLLATPTGMFVDAQGLTAERIRDLNERGSRLTELNAGLRAAAVEAELEFIDLTRTLRAAQTVDGVHPNPFGAEAIAARIESALTQRRAPRIDLRAGLAERGIEAEVSELAGFRRLDFDLPAEPDTAACILVAPHVTAAGRPWIWRARFFGHRPELDLALLDRGFHLAYCDVANLYGANAALARWDRFHALCVELGLGSRVTLEGMSRGGLPVLRWATARHSRTAAIYLDNPVCDLRSWPGGRDGKRSDADWERSLAAYGRSAAQAWQEPGPVEHIAPLATARVPLFLVYGTADAVVPPAQNTLRLAARYRALGAPLEVWPKPGADHHPHGLAPVTPLLRAVMRANGLDLEPTTRPLPSAEYRGAPAGWGGGTWWGQLEVLRALAGANEDVELVFLGDSITQGLTGASARLAIEDGERPFDRWNRGRTALSLGLSGDRTEHVLFRIEHGALARLDPRVIVLQIGINNLNAARHTATETALGIEAVVAALARQEPQASVILCGPFPAGSLPDSPLRLAVNGVHARIANLGDNRAVFYRDLRPLFLDEDGRPNARMRGDHLHISGTGQEAWLETIEPLVARLID